MSPSAFGLCLFMSLGSRIAAAEPPQAAEVAKPARDPLFAYALGALGLSGISVGATTGFLALVQKGAAEDHCSQTLRLCDATGRAANDTGRTLRDVSTVAWVIGGLGVGLSAYLLLTAPARQTDLAMVVQVDGTSPKAALVAHF